ncbi:hypothetical protein K458DRAFT_382978 [Lentithecium fluviatile CBS 122367]|uniref:Uncharacterized protein n=1 Tax=Lentithecium fluviatile CBS 122367 TaxID=1168545 RepID=A0A6G1JI00_9PLEO|nr:hypothetical protein K458DRAFT_382978 [Lentithecium fluviatile CBS 122367]
MSSTPRSETHAEGSALEALHEAVTAKDVSQVSDTAPSTGAPQQPKKDILPQPTAANAVIEPASNPGSNINRVSNANDSQLTTTDQSGTLTIRELKECIKETCWRKGNSADAGLVIEIESSQNVNGPTVPPTANRKGINQINEQPETSQESFRDSTADASISTHRPQPQSTTRVVHEKMEQHPSQYAASTYENLAFFNGLSDSPLTSLPTETPTSPSVSEAEHDSSDAGATSEPLPHPYALWRDRFWTLERLMAPTYQQCKAIANALGKAPGAIFAQITKHEGAEARVVTKDWYLRNKERILAGKEPTFVDEEERDQKWMWWVGLRDADAAQS